LRRILEARRPRFALEVENRRDELMAGSPCCRTFSAVLREGESNGQLSAILSLEGSASAQWELWSLRQLPTGRDVESASAERRQRRLGWSRWMRP
jgi:hypothetical protein